MAFTQTLDAIMRVAHMTFGGLWAGATLFMVGLVLPAARNGHIDAAALGWVTKRFSYLSIASVLAMLLTGGHLAGTLYTFGLLAGSRRGHLVLTMVALWFVLAGTLHVGTSRMVDRLDDGSAADAVAAGRTWYRASGVVALALLVVAGLL